MAMIDYGALLRVDGEFINKNGDFFMDSSDTGYICGKAIDLEGKEQDIDGNYFVYAGDEHFMLVFYKGIFNVISENRIIYFGYLDSILGETRFFDGFPSIKIEHLDKEYQNIYFEKPDDYDREWFITKYGKRKGELKINRRIKRSRKPWYKYLSHRYIATWEYDGRKYEVIFGYGIDNCEDIWNEVKEDYDGYNFSDIEKEIIDSWFAE